MSASALTLSSDSLLRKTATVLLTAGRKGSTSHLSSRIENVVNDAQLALAALSRTIQNSLRKRRAIVIPKLGVFATTNDKENSNSQDNLTIQFMLAPDFASRSGVKMRMKDGAGKGAITTKQKANVQFIEVSKYTNGQLNKDKCRKLIEGIVQNISDWIIETKAAGVASIELPGVGLISFRKNVCNFENDRLCQTSQQNRECTFDPRSVDETESKTSRDSDFNSMYSSTSHAPSISNSVVLNSNDKIRQSNSMAQPPSVQRLKQKLIERGGCNGIHSIGRVFRLMDDSGDKMLSLTELLEGIKQFGVRMNVAEVEEVFQYFDRDRSGSISFDELLLGLRGEMSDSRRRLVRMAFNRMDKTGDGQVTVEDLEVLYDPSFNPDVQQGKRTKAEALRDFLAQFDGSDQDGIVTLSEFEDYYKSLSASIENDEYFELMIRNAYHIAGGKGAAENTTNMRALVSNGSGQQQVVTVENDFCRRSRSISNKEILNAIEPTSKLGREGDMKVDRYYANKEEQTPRRNRCVGANPPIPPRISGSKNKYHSATRHAKDTKHQSDQQQGKQRLAEENTQLRRTSYEENLFASTNSITGGDEAVPSRRAASRSITGTQSKRENSVVEQVYRNKSTAAIDEASFVSKQNQRLEQEQATVQSTIAPFHLLAEFMIQRKMEATDLLLSLGGNRVFGKCSMSVNAFVRGLSEKFPEKFSVSNAKAIANCVNENGDGSIDLDELCSKVKGYIVLNKLKSELRKQHGVEGIHIMHRSFVNADTYISNSKRSNIEPTGLVDSMSQSSFYGSDYNETLSRKCLSHRELQLILSFVCPKLSLNSEEMLSLYAYFDANHDGVVSTFELLDGLRGSNARSSSWRPKAEIVRKTWKALDPSRTGFVAAQDLMNSFNASLHPKVVQGNMSQAEAKNAFIRELLMLPPPTTTGPFGNTMPLDPSAQQNRENAVPGDTRISREAFQMYYQDIAGLVNSDDEFSHLLSVSWQQNNRTKSGNLQQRGQLVNSVNRAPKLDEYAKQLVSRVRNAILKQGGSDGIHKFSRILRSMDASGDCKLDLGEFQQGISHLGVVLNTEDAKRVFTRLDRDGSGHISMDELLIVMRGPMSRRRKQFVQLAFDRMDRNKDGTITVEDIEDVYDASYHPDVRGGRMSKRDALRVLLDQFDSVNRDGVVTREEFDDYYSNVSASIDSDDYFELMMRNAWHISGGKGHCANTTNRRVLGVTSNGAQKVIEVEDDLWMKSNDLDEINRRLLASGKKDLANIELYHASETRKQQKHQLHHRNPSQRRSGAQGIKQDAQPGNKGVNIISWEEPAREEQDAAKANRSKEIQLRMKAANAVQSIARAHKARKSTAILRNKQVARSKQEQELQQEQDRERNRIIRPQGKNWY